MKAKLMYNFTKNEKKLETIFDQMKKKPWRKKNGTRLKKSLKNKAIVKERSTENLIKLLWRFCVTNTAD